MCNLYSHTRNVEAMRKLFAKFDVAAQLVPQPGIFPDYAAPVIRNQAGADLPELALVRWGMPSSKKALLDAATKRADKLRAKNKPVDFDELLRMEPDSGTTNVRNTSSSHWKRWLGVESRCLVPFTSFSEFNRDAGGDIWFAFGEDRPTAFFAGIWAKDWTSVRKVKTGLETIDLYAFLTTDPNAEVGAIHPKAMPVILTTPEECEAWMTAPWEQARGLQRPLPDGSLQIVARGVKKDGEADA
ncbi:MAG TPA: SOS response-associated peptidase family protein [Bosea sp. (in: a-proteobacteria)]|jgi:putative SOS response-associated peptidase YedK|uniref:SOS response-associated peptidase n=1 Tax=Bosea sp. (in: a-proteobacteria) TaxID=1871050 RepID=UPI002E1093D6|nr:SOS response-associated peptidase family protein [Bosea sp. (in: a-proteobacteria)]